MRIPKKKILNKKVPGEQLNLIRDHEFPGFYCSLVEVEKCVLLNYLETNILIVKYYYVN